MAIRVRDQKRFLVGLLFLVVAAAVISQLGKLRLGSATHMGPGYFPMLLAIVLSGLGIVSVVQALRGSDAATLQRLSLAPPVLLTAGVVAFGLLIEKFGLVAATLALILLISYDRLRRHPVEVGVVFVAVAAFTSLLFVVLLGLPIAVF